MIIGLSGYARAGKDAVGSVLVNDYGFVRLSFAAPLKDLALKINPFIGELFPLHLSSVVDMWGWEYAKQRYPQARRFLQNLGTGCRETFGSRCWVDKVEAQIHEAHPAIRPDFVITDMRFENEAQMLTRSPVNGRTVRIHRPGIEAANAHVSEHDLDDWFFNYHLDNDGTLEDLPARVQGMFDALGR